MHRYGGFNKAPSCPAAFPKAAPWNICSHIAFVELDGQMSYKQAMAALATRNQAYAGVCVCVLVYVGVWRVYGGCVVVSHTVHPRLVGGLCVGEGASLWSSRLHDSSQLLS